MKAGNVPPVEEGVICNSELSPAEMQKIVQELQMHQIELEMQNEELRRTHLELDNVRSRYFDLYDQAPLGYCSINKKGLIQEANLAMAALLAVPRGRLIKQLLSRYILSEDQDIFYIHQKKLISSDAPQSYELRMIKSDATAFWVRIASNTINSDGSVATIQITITDITSSKQLEAQLRENEFRWKFAIEGSGDGLWDWDLVHNSVFFSKIWKEMLGYAEEDIGNDSSAWAERVHPEDKKVALAALHAHLSGDTPVYICEHRVLCKQGYYKWILARGMIVSRNSAGKPLRIIGTHTDVTARKLLENERNAALSLLQKIANRVPGVVYQYRLQPDGSASLPFASEAIREIYRVSPEEVREDASKIFAIVHPDDYGSLNESIQISARDLTQWRHKYRVKFADGDVRWLFGNALPEREADGSILWHGFITDITEAKRVDQLLLDFSSHLDLAQEQDRARISREIHDQLGSILTSLKMDLSWLQKKIPSKLAEGQKKINTMHSHLNDAIQTVRTIATELRPSILDHLGLVAAIEWQLGKFQRQSGLKCTLLVSNPELVIDENPSTAIFRIIQECLTNIARHAKATEVVLSLEIVESQLLLTLTDNGCGMSDAEMHKQGRYGILGMHERARYFHGVVTIDSSIGHGTRIKITMPQDSQMLNSKQE
ncbi:MAG: PAS domain-containing protein [Methylococcales bacterium]